MRPSTQVSLLSEKYQTLVEAARQRSKEEAARLEDLAAINTDASRARDLRTLSPAEGVQIDRTRQVNAKDFFNLGLSHSSGQRMDCRVEVLLRDKPQDKNDLGDVLICEVDSVSRWLLFPPVALDKISARMGDRQGELVVMIRGTHGFQSHEWQELLTLVSEDEQAIYEWAEMLGLSPAPPTLTALPFEAKKDDTALPLTNFAGPKDGDLPGSPRQENAEIPIGERLRLEDDKRPSSSYTQRTQTSLDDISGNSSCPHLPPSPVPALRRARASRYHSRHNSEPAVPKIPYEKVLESLAPISRENPQTSWSPKSGDARPGMDRKPSLVPSLDMPFIPKIRKTKHTIADDKSSAERNASGDSEPQSFEREQLSRHSVGSESSVGSALSPDEEIPPPPPAHKSSRSDKLKDAPNLDTPPRSKNRRTSSPLKREYQPSITSETSSETSETESESESDYDSDSEGTVTSDSSNDELEAIDMSTPLPLFGQKISPPASIYNIAKSTLAPSNSASQAPYRTVPAQPSQRSANVIGTIYSWTDNGRWEKLHPDECSIVISPGLIEAFALSAAHSNELVTDPIISSFGKSDINPATMDAGVERPLIALELTPLVPLRKSTAIDIEIRSPPTARSCLKTGGTVMFRSRTLEDCHSLYGAIHASRLNNPTYKALEQARIVGAYGGASYDAATAPGRRSRMWFGRKNSYRASTRAPSVSAVSSDASTNSFASAFAALRRLSGSSAFNIAKSSVGTNHAPGAHTPRSTDSGPSSLYTSSAESTSSGFTPPRTPVMDQSAQGQAQGLTSDNLKIRLYSLETAQKWADLGAARLSISTPPPGMRQASSLYTGTQKRVVVTSKHAAKKDQKRGGVGDGVLLDVVLGGGCWARVGVVGVVANVWEDVKGDDGVVGNIGAVGGVSGRTRKWMVQCASAGEAAWIFGLVGGGR